MNPLEKINSNPMLRRLSSMNAHGEEEEEEEEEVK